MDSGNFQPDLLFDPVIFTPDILVGFFGLDPLFPAVLAFNGLLGRLGWRRCGRAAGTFTLLARIADYLWLNVLSRDLLITLFLRLAGTARIGLIALDRSMLGALRRSRTGNIMTLRRSRTGARS
jgi:hypothetical protein